MDLSAVVGPVDVLGPAIKPVDVGVARDALVATVPQEAITPELTDVARSLRNNVDRIYEYVYDTIEFTPLWGLRKSSLGVIADKSGTALDQANLMATLLRAAGYTADVVTGDIRLAPAAMEQMFGTTNPYVISQLVPSAGISMPQADGIAVDAQTKLTSARFAHAWVRVTGKELGTTLYHFDPARKAMVLSPGTTPLATAMGYERTAFNASLGGAAGDLPGSVKGLNGATLRNNLHTYATNLINNLDSAHRFETLKQALGGRSIVSIDGQPPLRLTTNPVAVIGSVQNVWNAANPIPGRYRPSLRVLLAGIDKTFPSDLLWGKRLVVRYGADLKAVLTLDGVVQATATTAGVASQSQVLTGEADEPYDGSGGTYGDQTGVNAQKMTLKVGVGYTYAILNGWGDTNRGSVERHRRRIGQLRDSGLAADAEAVLGESLAMMGDLWLAERTGFQKLSEAVTKTVMLPHHAIGIAGHNGSPYVDIPLALGSTVALSNKPTERLAAFIAAAGFGSTLESTIIEQTQAALGISTVSLFQVANDLGNTFYDTSSATWPATKAKLLTLGYDAGSIQSAEGFVGKGFRLLIPGNGKLGRQSWSGYSFIAFTTNAGIGHIISGAKGGYSGVSIPPAPTTTNISVASVPPVVSVSEPRTGDPVSIVSGDFIHTDTDVSVGPGQLLQFQRGYNSGNASSDGPLGRGWGHGFDLRARLDSDGFQGLGEDSAADAAPAIVSLSIVFDLVAADTAAGTVSARTLLVTSLIQQWAGQALVDNAVTVGNPAVGGIALYVSLPNGLSGGTQLFRCRSPPGDTSKLDKPTNYRVRSATGTVSNFNPDGTVASIVDSNNVGLTFTYAGALSKVTHTFGWALNFTYTGPRLASVSNGVNSVTFGYDATNNLKTFTDARSKVTTYNYVSPGKLSQIFVPASPAVANVINTYDLFGRVKEQRNANNALTQYFVAGTRTEEIDALSRSRVWYFNPATRQTIRSIDTAGRTTTFQYDGRRSLTETRFPEGNRIALAYDAQYNAIERRVKPKTGTKELISKATFDPTWNKPKTLVNELGQTTTFTYDARGNLFQRIAPVVDGASPTTTTIYNARGQLTQLTDATARVTTFTYDEAGKKALVSKIVDPVTLKLTTTYAYDAVGNVATVTNPRGSKTTTTWTPSRQPLVETAPIPETGKLASITTYTYDANDRLDEVQRTLGTQVLRQKRQYTPTDKLRTVSAWAPAVVATTPTQVLAYDLADRLLTDTDREGRVTRYEYATNGQLGAIYRAWGTPLQTREVLKTYTPNGRLLTELSAANGMTTYAYDDYDRAVRTSFPSAVAPGSSNAADYELRTWDDAGRVTSLRTRSGQVFTYTSDALGRTRTRTGGGLTGVAYTLDGAGRSTKVAFADGSQSTATTYDSAGRAVTVVDTVGAWARTLKYGLDAVGNLNRLTWPDNSFVTYEYDANNQLRFVKESGTALLATFTWDQVSRLDGAVRGGVTTKLDYWPGGDVYHLSHDSLGTANDVTFTYGYNKEQQVVSAWAANPAYVYVPGAAATKTFVSDAVDRYKTIDAVAQSYDLNGNLTGTGGFTFGYDALNHLISASKTGLAATYGYDSAGRRVKKAVNGVVSQGLYSGAALIADYSAANALIRRYVPNLTKPGHTLVILEGTAKKYPLEDRLGNVVVIADATGNVVAKHPYGVFGESAAAACQPSAAGCVTLGWVGQPVDAETGLINMQARMYSADLGRFMQPDPIGYRDDHNLYAYTHNDPVNFVDLTGTERSAPTPSYSAPSQPTSIGTTVGVTLALPTLSGWQSANFSVTFPSGGDMKLPTPSEKAQAWVTSGVTKGVDWGLGVNIGTVYANSPNGVVSDVVSGASTVVTAPIPFTNASYSRASNSSGYVDSINIGIGKGFTAGITDTYTYQVFKPEE